MEGGIVTCQLRTFNNCKKVETEIGSEVSEAWRKKKTKNLVTIILLHGQESKRKLGMFLFNGIRQ